MQSHQKVLRLLLPELMCWIKVRIYEHGQGAPRCPAKFRPTRWLGPGWGLLILADALALLAAWELRAFLAFWRWMLEFSLSMLIGMIRGLPLRPPKLRGLFSQGDSPILRILGPIAANTSGCVHLPP